MEEKNNTRPTVITRAVALFQKAICVVSSFHYESYRRMTWGYPKAIVTARGVAVFIPSVAVLSTLSLWGPSIFGLIETVMLAPLLTLTVLAIDYVLIAYTYSGVEAPKSLKLVRWGMLTLSISLNMFVVAGSNTDSLLGDIEQKVRASEEFRIRFDDLAAREKLNTGAKERLQAEIAAADEAGKKIVDLEKFRDAELVGATLADGTTCLRGPGTKAKGFILEIRAARQIAETGTEAGKRYTEASRETDALKAERLDLEANVAKAVRKNQTPGMMVTVLMNKIFRKGEIDILISTIILLAILTAIDLSAVIMSHMTTPPELIRIVEHQTDLDVARSEFNHESAIRMINGLRPPVDIDVKPLGRVPGGPQDVYVFSDNDQSKHKDQGKGAA